MQRSSGQAHQGRKISPLVAGLGAAFVACAITATSLANNPAPVAAPAQAMPAANQCQRVPLMLLVSTTAGGGTVRFREGDYLSPPIKLSTQPQTVTFPRLRPETTMVEEVITIEGQATDLVTTSPLTNYRMVYPIVDGLLPITARWIPFKSC
jgi:hypothetical protein